LSESRFLVYAQDQGGGKFMSPVVNALSKTEKFSELIILVHPLSWIFFRKLGSSRLALADAVGSPPLSVATWEEYLKKQNINHVFCTTSSPYLDLTNCHLIVAAKKLGIPVMGILDHWKGLDRFFYRGEPAFLPDYICCIDEFCRGKLEKLGIPADRIYTVGHPYLEKICQKSWKGYRPSDKIRILLVSQPNTADQSFQGIFFCRRGKHRLIDEITCLATRVFPGQSVQIGIRPHPKERIVEALPMDVEVDKNQEWDQSIRENDIFVGFDSMALVEAHLAGKYCISLALPEFQGLSDNSIPLLFSRKARELSELSSALEDAMRMVTAGKNSGDRYRAIFADSTKRTLALLDQFFDGALS